MNKRLIALLLAMSLMLTLVACGNKTEETPEEDAVVEEEAPLPEEEDVVIESEVVDPEADVPAESVEEEQAPVEMPTVDTEVVEPEEEVKPEEAPVVTPEVEVPAAGTDLNAFYLSLMDTYGENFPATMNVCESIEMLDTFYPGLSAIDTKQMMIYQPMMGAVVCEIALVEVTNSADVDAVKAILQGRIDTQVEGGAWYPESIEGWKSNSRIVTNGNCLMMIAYSECDAVVEAFNGLF